MKKKFTKEEEKIWNLAIYAVMDLIGDDYINQSQNLSRQDELANEELLEMAQYIGDTLLKNPDTTGFVDTSKELDEF